MDFLLLKRIQQSKVKLMILSLNLLGFHQYVRYRLIDIVFPSSNFIGFVVDKVDSSVTRSDLYFRELFEQTGLYLYKTKVRFTNLRMRTLFGMMFIAVKLLCLDLNYIKYMKSIEHYESFYLENSVPS